MGIAENAHRRGRNVIQRVRQQATHTELFTFAAHPDKMLERVAAQAYLQGIVDAITHDQADDLDNS